VSIYEKMNFFVPRHFLLELYFNHRVTSFPSLIGSI